MHTEAFPTMVNSTGASSILPSPLVELDKKCSCMEKHGKVSRDSEHVLIRPDNLSLGHRSFNFSLRHTTAFSTYLEAIPQCKFPYCSQSSYWRASNNSVLPQWPTRRHLHLHQPHDPRNPSARHCSMTRSKTHLLTKLRTSANAVNSSGTTQYPLSLSGQPLVSLLALSSPSSCSSEERGPHGWDWVSELEEPGRKPTVSEYPRIIWRYCKCCLNKVIG